MVPSPPFLAFLLASGGKLKERIEADGGGLKAPLGKTPYSVNYPENTTKHPTRS